MAVNPFRKKRTLSPDQKQAMAERLANSRAEQNESPAPLTRRGAEEKATLQG
jgi:hypothetical protein